MASLPPVHLGALIFACMAAAALAHPPLEAALVSQARIFDQPRRQFQLVFSLGFSAAVTGGLLLALGYHFNPYSGVKLWAGMASLSFFMAMDMALARQRMVIAQACQQGLHTGIGRVRPMARKFAIVAMGSALLVAVLLTIIIVNSVDWLASHAGDPHSFAMARRSVIIEVVFVTLVLLAGVGHLILLYSGNLKRLLAGQSGALEAVAAGDLRRNVPVATADEFGVMAVATNAMIQGLRHRVELMDALSMAEAVQKSLLPASPPELPGVSMAATAIYSGQTGGDYYDFLELTGGKLAVVVADVSGHGLDAALLMASARGFLRQAALCLSDPSRIITTLNRHLARDVAGSGRFITLFMLVLDPRAGRMEWIRAGHDPALVYDPATGEFEELVGRGLPLAVDEESSYLPGWTPGWPSGKVIVLGTDGLWESFGPDGSMYGKARLRDVIRGSGNIPAQEILDAIILDWRLFLGGEPQEDDVTLVVIRVNGEEDASPS